MPDPIHRLRAGHRNIDRLLDVLTRQLRAFERGKTPDMTLMRDILDGLTRYTSAAESAGEGRVIDDLVRSDERFAPARVVLATEHEAITELGDYSLVLVEEIIDGAVLPRSALTTPVRRFVRLFRRHLRRETAYIDRFARRTDASAEQPTLTTPRSRQSTEGFAALGDCVDRTAALAPQVDDTGEPVCPACAIDAVPTTEPGVNRL